MATDRTKRALDGLIAFVILLGLAAIVGGITVSILGNMQKGVLVNVSTTITNETINFTTQNLAVNLGNSLANNGSESGGFTGLINSSITVANQTLTLTRDTDYGVNISEGQIAIRTASYVSTTTGQRYNVTYQFNKNSTGDDWLTFKEGKKGIKELASWWDEIAMVMAAIVIIGSLFALYGVYVGGRRP